MTSSPTLNDFPSLPEVMNDSKYDFHGEGDLNNSNSRNKSAYFLPGDEEDQEVNHQQYISPSAYGKPFPRSSNIQQSSAQDQGLLPPTRPRNSRKRNDSYSSIGSSVAPAGLHARGISNDNYNRSRGNRRIVVDPSTSSGGGGGGLEDWLKSQGASAGGENGSNPTNSGAPQGRIRRLGGNGSDAGSAISGWSQGGLSGSGRRKDRRQGSAGGGGGGGAERLNHRRPLPTFEADEGDDSTESIMQWRETSAVVPVGEATGGMTSSTSKSESLSSRRREKDREMNPSSRNESSTPLIVTSPGGGRRSTTGPPSSKGGRSSRISTTNAPPLPSLNSNNKADYGYGAHQSQSSQNSTPLRRAVRWLAKLDGKDQSEVTTTSILLTCILLKWYVGMNGWSGEFLKVLQDQTFVWDGRLMKPSFLSHLLRPRLSSDVWRLRGSETLDGAHPSPSD